jgi:hypothetical protein
MRTIYSFIYHHIGGEDKAHLGKVVQVVRGIAGIKFGRVFYTVLWSMSQGYRRTLSENIQKINHLV